MSEAIKVGIAGLGRSGWGIHARAIDAVPDLFRIVAVADPNEERQQEARDRFGCRAYSNYDDLVADDEIELMVVATPSHTHASDSIKAMRAGKDVLVEKPMAVSLDEVDAMIAVARETGRTLSVNQNYRYAADFVQVKEILDSGILGELLLMRITVHQFRRRWDWQTLKEYGGGILNNHGTHMIDWALLLIDDPDPEVFCDLRLTPLVTGDADSHAKVVIKPKSGPVADIELTHACAFPQDKWLVMGTQGSLVSDRKEIRCRYYDPASVPPLVLDRKPTPDRSYNREELPMQEKVVTIDSNAGGGVVQLYHDLYATLRNGAPLVITAESVRRQMAVLEKCRTQSPL